MLEPQDIKETLTKNNEVKKPKKQFKASLTYQSLQYVADKIKGHKVHRKLFTFKKGYILILIKPRISKSHGIETRRCYYESVKDYIIIKLNNL